MTETRPDTNATRDTIEVPAPTAWPIALAFGLAMLFAGLVTDKSVSALGAIVSIAAVIGWFRAVLPHEAHESLPIVDAAPATVLARREVHRIEIDQEARRAWLPREIYPISAGIKGGLAGSVAMAVLASAYGILSRNGIWYPINLLVAGFFPESATSSTAQLAAFHLNYLLIAVPVHLIMSLMVGLLYGAMLPMLPRNPILLGGFIAPVMWSGLIYGVLGIVNPVLNQRIDWLWFAISQFGFGIVAGIVVSRQERVFTSQAIPFAIRMGMEGSGMRDEPGGKDQGH
jgi:hypothetical protein